MSDDYLWDKSGEPDPEVQKLERSLSPLGHRDAPLGNAGGGRSTAPARFAGAKPERFPMRFLLVAAAVLVVAGGVALALWPRPTNGWAVVRLEGDAARGRAADRGTRGASRSATGSRPTLRRARASRWGPKRAGSASCWSSPARGCGCSSRGTTSSASQLALGTVTAIITAPPRQFVVETPVRQGGGSGLRATRSKWIRPGRHW